MRAVNVCLIAAAAVFLAPSPARAQDGGATLMMGGGPPSMGTVSDTGNGTVHMTWSGGQHMMGGQQFRACAWDLYDGDWAPVGPDGGPWCYFPVSAQDGDVNLHHSGAYHMWIGGQYSGMMSYCNNPWTGVVRSGAPHVAQGVWAEHMGNHRVRMHWTSDNYGTWHYQMIAYHMGAGWTQTHGPSGTGMWHFVDFGGTAYDHGMASFSGGWADFDMPGAGDYWLYMRPMGWDGASTGEFSAALVSIAP